MHAVETCTERHLCYGLMSFTKLCPFGVRGTGSTLSTVLSTSIPYTFMRVLITLNIIILSVCWHPSLEPAVFRLAIAVIFFLLSNNEIKFNV